MIMVSETDLNGSHSVEGLKKVLDSEKMLNVKDVEPEEEVLILKNGETPER